jgi:hypothetical protein
MRTPLVVGVVALALAGCVAPPASHDPTSPDHAERDPNAERVKAALADAFGMEFISAGPHHELGTDPDGVQLDLIGMPVEEVVLSLPSEDRSAAVERGLAYLPHLRDLLHGGIPVWRWAIEALACREDPDAACETSFSQGNLEARYTDGGPDFLVLVIARDA